MSERLRVFTIFLLTACQSTQAVALGGVAMLLPLIREELGLSFAQSGMIGVASGLTYAAMQIPAGYLCDRIGAKRMFLVGLVGTNLSMMTFALIENYHLLLANQMVSGVLRALVFAPGLLLVQAEFPESRRATASGLFLVGGLASNMLINLFGPIALPFLGWRGLLIASASSVLVIAAAYALLGAKSAPHQAGLARGGEVSRILGSSVIWWAGSTHFARHSVAYAWNYWLITILVTEKAMTLQFAAALVAMGSAVTMLANVVGGYVSDRLQKPTLVISVSFFSMAIILFAFAQARSLPVVIACVALVSIFVQFAFGPMFAYPVRIFGARSAGFVSGFSNTCANCGGLAGAYVVGLMKDVTGTFSTGLSVLVGLCLVAIAATGMLDRAGRAHLVRMAMAHGPNGGRGAAAAPAS